MCATLHGRGQVCAAVQAYWGGFFFVPMLTPASQLPYSPDVFYPVRQKVEQEHWGEVGPLKGIGINASTQDPNDVHLLSLPTHVRNGTH
jgi:hypothetical protein